MIAPQQPGILQVRIPDLPPATAPLTGTELAWIVQNGLSKKVFLRYVGNLGTAWTYRNSDYTASAADRVGADTSGGSWTLTLPAGPTQGDVVEVADVGGAFQTNNLTVATSSTIEGLASPMLLDLTRVRVVFLYNGTTWKVSGD